MKPGPAPKPDSERVRRNKTVSHLRSVTMHKTPAPKLTRRQTMTWGDETHAWWKMWTESALTADFTAEDWSELLDTALLHSIVWDPDQHGSPSWFKATAQLRQRTAAYGATPLDRQKLRIQVVFADDAEEKQATRRAATKPSTTRERRGPLKAV